DHERLPGGRGRGLRPGGHRHRRPGERPGGGIMSSATTTAPEQTAPVERSGGSTPGKLGNGLTMLRSVPMWPAFALLIAFMLGPILYSVYLAFTDNAIRGAGAAKTSFVGFDNFIEAFTDAGFWNSVGLTLIFTVVS